MAFQPAQKDIAFVPPKFVEHAFGATHKHELTVVEGAKVGVADNGGDLIGRVAYRQQAATMDPALVPATRSSA